jgi:DNA-binding transcriptional LysR family regulator
MRNSVDLPLVGLHANSALHNLLARAAAEEGKPLNFLIRVTSFDAVCAMVSAGLGISIIPKAAASPYTTQLRLRALPLTDEWAKRQLFICHHRTVFSEGVGWKAHVPMLLGTGRKMRPVQRLDFSTGEAKKKIFREARSVALGLLI